MQEVVHEQSPQLLELEMTQSGSGVRLFVLGLVVFGMIVMSVFVMMVKAFEAVGHA